MTKNHLLHLGRKFIIILYKTVFFHLFQILLVVTELQGYLIIAGRIKMVIIIMLLNSLRNQPNHCPLAGCGLL
jgi:hypothetical protein